jgi:hypothetical protein
MLSIRPSSDRPTNVVGLLSFVRAIRGAAPWPNRRSSRDRGTLRRNQRIRTWSAGANRLAVRVPEASVESFQFKAIKPQ